MIDGNYPIAVIGHAVRMVRVKDGRITQHMIENAKLADAVRAEWRRHREPA